MYALASHAIPMREIDRSARLVPWRQIAADLRDGIANGTYPPDSLLPSISRLTQQYGVARRTANKALRQLASEGLADLEPGMGYYVTAGHTEGT
jgi:DNA-binding GntR family transcriptional regulator